MADGLLRLERDALSSSSAACAQQRRRVAAQPLTRAAAALPPRPPPACSNHRGLRHYWGLTVRGQHTKTTGRRGKTVGVAGAWSGWGARGGCRRLLLRAPARSTLTHLSAVTSSRCAGKKK